MFVYRMLPETIGKITIGKSTNGTTTTGFNEVTVKRRGGKEFCYKQGKTLKST